MAMTYHIFHRRWQARRPVWILMIFELAGIVPALVLFGIAQPDMYRTQMWQVGYDNGFNSNPAMILYAYANHRPLPTIPFIWSSALTELNVAISVLSLFVLLVKLIAWIMKIWYPLVGLLSSIVLTALYTASVYGQAGPDHADPRHPSPAAWYLRYSCQPAVAWGAEKHCQLAKGTFAVTVYLLTLYVVNLGLAIWSMLPDKRNDMGDEDEEEAVTTEQKTYEMMPATPFSATPFTPRTQAFHTLERKLPLRDRYQ